ncbi:hypothetical protein [Saccharopolyspora elongata]|uniref:Uncharacterized protein n=1 Tax=Saccharopolyspora elongata TaxID=2530387 RepID=A0A4R4ZAS7_9PSEU|nr:hypothetical protein [Saccharopolyspora elongata]TDD53352.1 hypothetical protein E1288_09555 [Saccharopolyspora elongata]
MPNWDVLTKKTAALTFSEVTKSDGNQKEVTVSGLRVRLSEIGACTQLMSVFADTLVVDYPTFDAPGVVVVARSLDLSALSGSALPLRVPAGHGPNVAQFLIGGTVGGDFRINTENVTSGAKTVPVGMTPLKAALHQVAHDGTITQDINSGAKDIADLTGRPWALGSLKASVTAAGSLMDTGIPADTALARSMLAWVVACIQQAGQTCFSSATVAELATVGRQAAALLATLDVASGARYVPVLPGAFYKDKTTALLGVLGGYQADLNTLSTAQETSKALKRVAGTLAANAKTETDPLTVRLHSITSNVDHLKADLTTLTGQLDTQYNRAHTAFTVMRAKIALQDVQNFVDAYFGAVIAVVKVGVGAAQAVEDPTKVSEVAHGLYDAADKAYTAIGQIPEDQPGDDELLQATRTLLRTQQRIIASFESATTLWNAQDNETIGASPRPLTESDQQFAADPTVAWDVYLTRAQAALDTIKQRIGQSHAEEAQQAANNYWAELMIFGRYGKALAVTANAYAAQLAEASMVRAQIKATNEVADRWKALEQTCRTDKERQALLMGILQTRVDTVKRSLHVAWTYYRDAYFYLYFAQPPAIDLDAPISDIRRQLAAMTDWVERAISQSGNKVQLPGRDATISLDLPIIHADTAHQSAAGVIAATLAQDPTNKMWTLSWTVPMGAPLLAQQLPDNGNVAIWVTSAEFFVDDVTPNPAGRVIVEVATSGCYQNGFGPAESHTFVAKGITGTYAYKQEGKQVYSPWEIGRDVYMTPTLFTQWTMTFDQNGGNPQRATKLRLNFHVDYQKKPH